MNYISSSGVSAISNKSFSKISQGFKIKDNYCKATMDLINYKDIILAVNAFFLSKNKQGDRYCRLEFVIPVNKALPSFKLHATSLDLIFFILGICLFFISYILAKTTELYVGVFFIAGIGSTFFALFNFISSYFRKLRMNFSNSEFNKKYSVSGDNVDQIKSFFTDSICNKLANYELKHNVISKNNLLVLDTFGYSFDEKYLSIKITEFIEEAVNVAIIFNDTDSRSESVSNKNNPELTAKKLLAYFRTRCTEEQCNPF